MATSDEFSRFLRELEGLNKVEKIKFAAEMMNHILDQLEDDLKPDEELVFDYFVSLMAIVDVSQGRSLNHDTYENVMDAFFYTNNDFYCNFTREVYPYIGFEYVYNEVKKGDTIMTTMNIHQQLSEDNKTRVGMVMLVFASLDGIVTDKEAKIALDFADNGYWNKNVYSDSFGSKPSTSNTIGFSMPAITPDNASKPVSSSPRQSYSYSSTSSDSSYDEGSGLIGFILVFFLNWLGLIIAVLMKKRKTTRGAIITFVVEIALGIFVGILGFALVAMGIISPEMIEAYAV